jgi:CrcB protein
VVEGHRNATGAALMLRDPHPELPLDPDPPDVRRPPRPWDTRPALLAVVAVGGLVGTPARYAIAQALATSRHGWPIATFLTNLAGAFALGVLLELLARRGRETGRRQLVRLLVGTGALGAFTTYSTLAVEADLLVRDSRPLLALAYALASVALGVVAAAAGIGTAAAVHR